MEYTETLFLIGRILYGGFFLMMGLHHFLKRQYLAGYAKSKGVGSPDFMVLLSGLLLVLGGLGVLLGLWIEWALLFIVIFLISVSFQMHAFWKLEDPQARMIEMTHFMKNIALLGAALMMYMIATPWVLALSL